MSEENEALQAELMRRANLNKGNLSKGYHARDRRNQHRQGTGDEWSDEAREAAAKSRAGESFAYTPESHMTHNVNRGSKTIVHAGGHESHRVERGNGKSIVIAGARRSQASRGFKSFAPYGQGDDNKGRDGKLALDPLTDKGEKIMSSMKKEYGGEKGESVFYASKNKGTIEGVDEWSDEARKAAAESRRGFQAKGEKPTKLVSKKDAFKAPGGHSARRTPTGLSKPDALSEHRAKEEALRERNEKLNEWGKKAWNATGIRNMQSDSGASVQTSHNRATDEWSDEARKKAAESRKGGGKKMPPGYVDMPKNYYKPPSKSELRRHMEHGSPGGMMTPGKKEGFAGHHGAVLTKTIGGKQVKGQMIGGKWRSQIGGKGL